MLQHGDDWAKGLAAGKYEVLERHLDMVLSANQCLNLTAIEDRAEARRLHIADSLSAVPELNKAPEGTFVDLGSGAGYPGIPLAVASGRKAILLESRKKRSAFLREIVESLKLSAEVIALRAEEVAKTRHGEFAAVITRAVAPLPALVELSAPLLVRGGLAIAMKGDLAQEELDAGDRAAEIVGLSRFSQRRFVLAGGGEQRCIVAYEKVAKSQIPLPRRPGRAQKQPLGRH